MFIIVTGVVVNFPKHNTNVPLSTRDNGYNFAIMTRYRTVTAYVVAHFKMQQVSMP